ncbi:MAG TPA: Fic family protein [Salinivirgaceae bacterium]|nr:Fic family protein [Salinivirgaceae bacterium]HQA76529.1 Fic family protein [Salinivirgaceae bacterium]
MEKRLKLISVEYLQEYSNLVEVDWFDAVNMLKAKTQFSLEDFEYYIIASSLYSSNIEGNTLDVNSFFRNRGKKTSPKKKEVQEIEALMEAYKFASENKLNRANFLKTHYLLSKTLLPAKERGVLRKEQVGIRDSKTLKPVYLAVEPQFLKEEFSKLFDDIDELLKSDLSYKEIFYFASMIHIWLAKIHPFIDGNGRSARLLEKWFLVSKLGIYAWSINSEKYYWDNRPDYYQNIALGYNYYVLNWNRCIPFLLMLPKAMQ